jgi:hypothetical protein
MSEVLQANIFFFITGIAVIVFTALLCVALFHVIKVLKSLRRVMDRVEEGTEIIAEDMQNVRAYFTEDGFVRRLITSLIGSSHGTMKSREHKHSKTEKKRTELKIKDEA